MARKTFFRLFFFTLILAICQGAALAEPVAKVPDKARCPVCGMFVAKHDSWIAQIKRADDGVEYFDGVKDMLAYYFSPGRYGGKADIQEIWVRDYYTLDWMDGQKAYYVSGSDQYGPMGHEFIPFATKDSALAFARDHKGKEVLPFQDITPDRVESLRAGARMQ